MPYDVNNPPAKIRKLSVKKRKQWVSVFNNCYAEHGDDALCHKMAWGVVNKSSDCGDCEEVNAHLALAVFNEGAFKSDLEVLPMAEKENGVLDELARFSTHISGGTMDKDIPDPEQKKKKNKDVEPPKVDVTTPQGARSMALGLSRIFGGWKGGCRLSPSANRSDSYHLSVLCETAQEMGQRILDLKSHLLTEGYKEESEGVFINGNQSVCQGRSYPRRKGKRPLAFMVTVRSKS